jgi:hypothetical protein
MADATICPSTTPAAAGSAARIVGVIGADGRVANLVTPIPASAAVLEAAGPRPETKFRFAAPCAEGGCTQWRDSQCSLIGRIRAAIVPEAQERQPVCSIRGDCRWFMQDGRDACAVCSYVSFNPSDD